MLNFGSKGQAHLVDNHRFGLLVVETIVLPAVSWKDFPHCFPTCPPLHTVQARQLTSGRWTPSRGIRLISSSSSDLDPGIVSEL